MIAASSASLAAAAAVSLGGAVALLALERLGSRRRCVIGTLVVLAAVLTAMLLEPFHPALMGDYRDFVQSRQAFVGYFGTTMRFQYHLGGAIVRAVDAALGRTAHSPVEAFDVLAGLASVVFIMGLAILAKFKGFSRPVLRYLAIVLAAPPTLLFFGYHEFGYLPDALMVWAIPLALVGLEEERGGLVVAGAAALGVGAALHGFGLVAVGFLGLVTLVYERQDGRQLAVRIAQVAGAAMVGWLAWLPVYFIGFGWTVVSDHADFRPIRPLFHTHAVASAHRFDYAVFSHIGLRDIFFEFVILGVFAAALVLLLPRGRLWEAVVVATVPAVLFVIFFWPIQGLGNDTDFLGSAFPALYGVGWLAARSRRAPAVLVAALAVGQLALLHVVRSILFIHGQDF